MNVMEKSVIREREYEKEFGKFLEKERHLGLMARSRAERLGNKVAVRHKPYGEWISYTWKQFGGMIDSAAKALLEIGVKELEMVGIFASNSAFWAMSDFACFSVRACSVPVYATNSAKELEYIVKDAGIRVLFVGDQAQYDKAMSAGKGAGVEYVIVYDRTAKIEAGRKVMYFDDFLELGRKSGRDSELKDRIAKLDSGDLSTLIYTSGTTGEPKGVMLTHRNWLAMLFGTGYFIKIVPKDVNLAFLPLSHVFERAWSYYMLCNDAQVDYCHDTKAIMEFLKESRPHYMCSVPRMWEKVHATVLEQIKNAPEKKQKIFNWALKVGGLYQSARKDGAFISPPLRIKHAAATALVLKKIRSLFGGRSKIYNVGGSAFSGEIAEFFFNAGVLLLQGYGMTECFVISVANTKNNKFGTCGPVVPLMKVRISPEGEIQANGPSMTQGYWKKPDLTKELFTDDGWIKTGDVGQIDGEGFITITDRIRT